MSDKNPPRPETDDEREARLRREALFEDLPDEPAAAPETEAEKQDALAALRAERDQLLAQNGQLTTALGNAQRDNLSNFNRAEEAGRALARVEAKAEQDKKFAAQKLVQDLLPVVDTMELGLKAIPAKDRAADPKFDKLAQGLEITLQQLTAVFNRYGVREINPLGESFDEARHEALAMVPSPGAEPATVIDVQQKGYEIEGRLIRPAKVIVTPPA
jgi:molecular chaperone GrpE